ncbi:unnamed protein product [Phyllotreta striolata]|uniref:Uncharacterized protein n=1 Tax=Phyllotreta striolata TaxID=444603 RepID=A0A9N9TVM3_PHYSR|nr:unnamed protein product [Phyllotreta striolata]
MISMKLILHCLMVIRVYSTSYEGDAFDDSAVENIMEADGFGDEYKINPNDIISLKNKKSSPLCTVKKILKLHPNDGYEYHPKHYHEHECVPANSSTVDNDFSVQNVCVVHQGGCVSLEKTMVFVKKPRFSLNPQFCQMEIYKIPVKVGCNCIHHIKHQYI